MFEVAIAHHHTAIGWLTLTANHLGITKIEFGQVGQEFRSSPFLTQAINELDQYFSGNRRQFTVPLSLTGTPFQKIVWNALRKIPFGATPGYSDIGASIGRPSVARAVGMANNKNPVPIIIPCHRVIGRNGSLVGYAGGLNIKRQLLDIELCDGARTGFKFPQTPHFLVAPYIQQ
jgi:methylated-DNA-[protein]-cysteine S-methyltransferase